MAHRSYTSHPRFGAGQARSICSEAFETCKGLVDVSIPDSIDTIEEKVFWGCESLRSVTIPDSVRDIGEEAFGCCKCLKSVTMRDEFDRIGDRAFYGTGIESIRVPFAKEYGEGVFEFCHELKPAAKHDGSSSLHVFQLRRSSLCVDTQKRVLRYGKKRIN